MGTAGFDDRPTTQPESAAPPADGLYRGDPDERLLWRRLTDLQLDDGSAAFGFARRLARDNGWSAPFAARAIEEYRRFLFLGQVAGHPVTPSDEVDQVWHLHLTYTRSYWGELCGEVLGSPFHHGPTRGGSAEAEKFDDWYARTLASYRDWFGTDAPSDLWPSAERRFGDAPYFVRVNTRRQWVVNKPPAAGVATRSGGLAAAALVLAGCSGGAVGMLAQSSSGSLLPLLVIGGVVVAVVVMLARAAGGNGGRGRRRGGHHDDGGVWMFGSFGSDGDSDGDSGGGDSGCGGGGCGGGCGGCGS